jgi:hypothetical protein
MIRRTVLGALVLLSLAACGGSGDGGNGNSGGVVLTNFQSAGSILGQSTTTGGTINNGGGATPNQAGLNFSAGRVANGSLYVPDAGNNRVLGFNAVPGGFAPLADFVLGQAAFNTNAPAATATGLSFPLGCAVGSNALFVADAGNGRVLVFSPPPTTTGAAASVALGKPDLTTGGATNLAAGLSAPNDVSVGANRVVVADRGNNRIMIWNGIPIVSGANANFVVGQPDFGTTTAGVTQAKTANPFGVWTDGTRLVVADTDNNRVLIWNTFPTVSGQLADLVVGQPDFTTSSSGNGTQKMNSPRGVCSDGQRLFVADAANNRVLIFSPFPSTNNPAAVGVLGQSNFTNVTANDDDQNGVNDGTPSDRTMSAPEGLTAIGNQLFVSDPGNNRVLVFTGT